MMRWHNIQFTTEKTWNVSVNSENVKRYEGEIEVRNIASTSVLAVLSFLFNFMNEIDEHHLIDILFTH